MLRLLTALALLLVSVESAFAQVPEPRPTPAVTAPAGEDPGRPDFLFGQPRGSAAFRGGWMFARADSDIFAFVRDQFTIDRNAFSTAGVAGELSFFVSPRLEVVGGVDYSRSETPSEYRRFVDNNRQPITQATSLEEANVSGSIRFTLTPRGRQISRFVWIPRSIIPYVGAGAGALFYDFQQTGDFVDFVDLSVFPATFRARGWTPSAHVMGGVDVRIFQRWFLNVDARYLWGRGDLGGEFEGFDRMSLGGLRMGAGINVLF